MVKTTGASRHARRLKKLRNIQKGVATGLFSAGLEIEDDARESIIQGSVSGSGHVPSAPGQPPNRDTGFLDTNIETIEVSVSPPTVHVISNAPYSAALEFGTSKMAERPYMRPATEKNRAEVGRKVAQAVRVTVRRG